MSTGGVLVISGLLICFAVFIFSIINLVKALMSTDPYALVKEFKGSSIAITLVALGVLLFGLGLVFGGSEALKGILR